MRRFAAALFAVALTAGVAAADEIAVYRASGTDAGLFDQYDNDGYSLAVAPAAGGSLELRVRVSAGPLESRAPFPTQTPRDRTLPSSPERDTYARSLAGNATTQAAAVERILAGVASAVRYDPDRARARIPPRCSRRAGPTASGIRSWRWTCSDARGSRRARCRASCAQSPQRRLGKRIGVGLSPVDRNLLSRPRLRLLGPSSSINSVDARYVPFGRRALERPRGLTLTRLESSGRLDYPLLRLPETTLRVRPVGRF